MKRISVIYFWLVKPYSLILTICVLFLLISMMAFFIGYKQYKDAKDHTLQSDRITANLLSDLIAEHEKATLGILQSYALRPLFINAVEKWDSAGIARHMVNLKENNDEIDRVFVTDTKGILRFNYPHFKESIGVDLSYRDWYKGVSREWKHYVSTVFKMIVSEKELALVVCVPIINTNGKVIGILANLQRTTFFRDNIKHVPLDAHQKVALIDQMGQVIYSNVLPYTGEIYNYPQFPLIKKTLSEQTYFVDREDPNAANNKHYTTLAPLKGIGWTIVIERDSRGILKAEYERFVLTASFSFLIFSIILLSIVSVRKSFLLSKTTELLAMERHMKEETEKFVELFENIGSGVAVYEARNDGEDFIFKAYNAAAELLDKTPREQAIGRSVVEVFPMVKDFGLFDIFRRVYRTGKPERHPITLYKDKKISGWRENYVYKLSSGEIVAIYDDVTKIKVAEEKIKKAAQDWQTTFDSIKDPIMFLDREFNIIAFNEALASFLDLPREKILGNSCFTLVHRTNKPFDSCPITRMMLTKKHEETEIYNDEKGVWISVSVNPVFDETGNMMGAVHVFKDITFRKEAEYTLKVSETQYRRLFETAMDGILILDAGTGQIDDVNPFLIDMLGYTYEEFRGKKLWEVGTFKDVEASKIMFTELQNTGHVRYEDLPLLTKDGREIAVEFVSNVYIVDSRKVIQCNIRNISDRKLAEEKQKISDDKYRSIFENAVEGIFQTTPEGKLLTGNPAMARMFGFTSPEDMISGIDDIGKQLYMDPEDRVRYKKTLEEQGIVQNYERQHYRKDGSKFWVSVNARAVRDSTGKMLYYEGSVEDITTRKTADEVLKENAEKLRKSLSGTIRAISMIVETRDPYTAGHQRKVSDLARVIAQDMGLPKDTVDNIRMAGIIHDIGKISVPAEILSKPGKLTHIEMELIKTHSKSGYNILKDVELPYPIAEIVLQHHERLDGSGYPQGLKNGQILLESQIISIADVVEAIASHRPYRPARGIGPALEEIEKNKGILYGDKVVEVCLRLFREKEFKFEPTGS
jgi:PAS domain S-box-containing protein